jgi:hypothetical protein
VEEKSERVSAGAPPRKAPFPSSPAAITSGTFFLNKMIAWVMSKAPAIRPPTAIAKSAFLLPNCIIWSFEDGHYIGARLTRKRKNRVSGKAARTEVRCQRSDVSCLRPAVAGLRSGRQAAI